MGWSKYKKTQRWKQIIYCCFFLLNEGQGKVQVYPVKSNSVVPKVPVDVLLQSITNPFVVEVAMYVEFSELHKEL